MQGGVPTGGVECGSISNIDQHGLHNLNNSDPFVTLFTRLDNLKRRELEENQTNAVSVDIGL